MRGGQRGRTLLTSSLTNCECDDDSYSSTLQRLASSKAGITLVPVSDSGLVHLPTEVDLAAITETWEVDKTHIEVLDLNAEVVNLAHLFADRSGQFGDAHLMNLKSCTVAIQESEGSESTEFGELTVKLAFFGLERSQKTTEKRDKHARFFDCEVPPLEAFHDCPPRSESLDIPPTVGRVPQGRATTGMTSDGELARSNCLAVQPGRVYHRAGITAL